MATIGNVPKGSERQIVLHVYFRSGSIEKKKKTEQSRLLEQSGYRGLSKMLGLLLSSSLRCICQDIDL